MAAFLSGCGGGSNDANLLPRAIGLSLASQADFVASDLRAHRTCRALQTATELRGRLSRGLRTGRIDGRFRPVLGSIDDLARSIPCHRTRLGGTGGGRSGGGAGASAYGRAGGSKSPAHAESARHTGASGFSGSTGG